jgi:ABC-type nitrate/sulfonate/bicarbonate transport system substrate-binding protein
MIKQRLRNSAVWFCAVVFAASVAGVVAYAEPTAAAPTKFALATFQGESYILDAIATKNGIFAKNGLEVMALTPQSGAQAIQFIVGGSINGWSTNPTLPLPAVAQGKDLVIVGMLSNWITFAVQMRSDLPLPPPGAPFKTRMEALRGKTLGVTGVGAVTYIALMAALQLADMPKDAVTVVGVGSAQNAVGQVKAKRLDGYVSFSNADAGVLAQEGGTVEYINFLTSPGIPNNLRALGTYAMVTSRDYYESHPDVIAAWVKSLGEALAWLRDNPGEGAKILSESSYGGKFESVCTQAVKQVLASSKNETTALKVSKEALSEVLQLMAQTGQAPGKQITYDELVPRSARE